MNVSNDGQDVDNQITDGTGSFSDISSPKDLEVHDKTRNT